MKPLSRLSRWWTGTVMPDLRRELPVIVRHQRDVGAVRDVNGTVIAWTAGPVHPDEQEAPPGPG